MLFLILSTWLQATEPLPLMPKQSGVLGFMRNPNIVSKAENHEQSERYARALESFMANRLYKKLSKHVRYCIEEVANLKAPTTAQLLGYIQGWDPSDGKLWDQDEEPDSTIVFEESYSLTFFKYGNQICCAPTTVLGTNYAGYAAALKSNYAQVFTDTGQVRPLLPAETREFISSQAQFVVEELATPATQTASSGELVVRNQETQLQIAEQLPVELYHQGNLVPLDQRRFLALCHRRGQHASFALKRMFGLYLLKKKAGESDWSIGNSLRAVDQLSVQEREQALQEFLSKATDTCDNLERVMKLCLKEFSTRGGKEGREKWIPGALLNAFCTGSDMDLFYNTLRTICLLNEQDRREGAHGTTRCAPIIDADGYMTIISQMANLGIPLPHSFLGLVLRLEGLFLEKCLCPITIGKNDAEKYNVSEFRFDHTTTLEVSGLRSLPMDHKTWVKLINAIRLVAAMKHEGLYEYFNLFLQANSVLPLWDPLPSSCNPKIVDPSKTHEELYQRLKTLFPEATIPDPKVLHSVPVLPGESEDRSTQQSSALELENAKVVLPDLWKELDKKVKASGADIQGIQSSFPLDLTQQASPRVLKENWKQSYKKVALLLHPDKNVGKEAAVQTAFQILQDVNAYITGLPDKDKW